jgi:hypothetical protein
MVLTKRTLQKVRKQTRLNLPGGQTVMQAPAAQPVSLHLFLPAARPILFIFKVKTLECVVVHFYSISLRKSSFNMLTGDVIIFKDYLYIFILSLYFYLDQCQNCLNSRFFAIP